MGGGHFDYIQGRLECVVVDELKSLITNNPYDYTESTIRVFKQGLSVIEQAIIYMQRIDWLVSDDDSESTFHSRLTEDMQAQTLNEIRSQQE